MAAYLLDAPVNLVVDVLLNLLLTLVAKAQSFKRVVQVNEPFRDAIGVILAIGAMLRVGVDEFTVATNEVGGRTPVFDAFGNRTEEKEDSEALFELELLDTDANEPIEALKCGKSLRGIMGGRWSSWERGLNSERCCVRC